MPKYHIWFVPKVGHNIPEAPEVDEAYTVLSPRATYQGAILYGKADTSREAREMEARAIEERNRNLAQGASYAVCTHPRIPQARPLFRAIATAIDALKRCQERAPGDKGAAEWEGRWTETIERYQGDHLPRGSGIDSGCTIDIEASRPDCLILNTSFHHMDEVGHYDGWTDHTIRVRPSLIFTIDITISGRNRNDIKDYLADVFREALMSEVET